MAFDANLLFHDNRVISTEAVTSAAVEINKTPADGFPIEYACVTMTTQNTQGSLVAVVKECATSDGTFTTLATFPTMTTAGGVKYMVVQTTKKYLKIVSTPSGTTPSFTIKAGVVSGPPTSAGYTS